MAPTHKSSAPAPSMYADYKLNTGLLVLVFCTIIGCGSKGQLVKGGDQRPNIVLILADDLGFSDLGCYGGEISTPQIDKLAKDGIRFTQFYNAARCCPSRASILTGLYPHQAGIGHMVMDLGYDGYRGDLSQNSVTIAQVLEQAGYQTMMAGKWHLSKFINKGQSNANWPLQRGFQQFYGTLPGAGSYWDPYGLMEDNQFIQAKDDYYYTEAITKKATGYIRKTSGERPFFLYVAYTAPHYPMHARQNAIQKYRGKFAQGWDKIRLQRYNRLVQLGLIDSAWALPERDEQSVPWEQEQHKEWQQSLMEVYAAMIDQMDEGIGQIVAELKKKEVLENTLIMILSDNGGSAEGHMYGKIERLDIPWTSKMIPAETRSGTPVRAGEYPGVPLGPDSTFGSYGVKWANVSNTPFRLHKSWVHEGGISTPFIAHWPKQISGQTQLRHQIAHVVDIMPTCLELAGADYPSNFQGQHIVPIQGESLVSIFKNEAVPVRTLFWEHEGNRAIRKGRWKLVSEYPGEWKALRSYPNKGAWELYDMIKDRTEVNDLAKIFPEVVDNLAGEWEYWARQSQVISWSKLEPN